VEVRICDAQPTAAESDALAALIVAAVQAAARDHDAGVPFIDPPPRLIEENLWRAIRHGMDGELIDLDRGVVLPAREAVERLVDWSGADVSFPELNGAQRQRRQIDAGLAMDEIYGQLVAETAATYGERVRSS
jgi:carboxylate-amine ligase